MTYGLLGMEFTVAYLLMVLIGPTILGFLYNVLVVKSANPPPIAGGSGAATSIQLEEFDDDDLLSRVRTGLRFSFGPLLIAMSPWIILGYVLGSISQVMISYAPESLVSQYFSDPGLLPLIVAAGFGALTHV